MDYISIGIGILVSALFFYISYTKTIGAKNERVNSTYGDIVKLLVRNLVNNDYLPSVPEINRILKAKAIEKKFNISDLPDEITFVHALYSRIVEDEIISSTDKMEYINKINRFLDENENSFISTNKELKSMDKEKTLRFMLIISSLIVAVSSVIVTNISATKSEFSLIIPLIAILLTLVVLNILFKLKEEQEEPKVSIKSVYEEYKKFEDKIFKILKPFHPTKENRLIKNHNQVRFDISFKKNNKMFFIEIKFFNRYVQRYFLKNLINLANSAKDMDKNYILILVVNDKRYLKSYVNELGEVWDYIFDETELISFRNELIHKNDLN